MKLVGKITNLVGQISKSQFKFTQHKNEPFFDIDDITKDRKSVGFAQYKYNKEYGINYFTIFIYRTILVGFIDKHNSTINIYYYDGYNNEFDRNLNQCDSVILPEQVTRGNWYK